MFSKRPHLPPPPSLIAVIPLLVVHHGVIQYGIHVSHFQGLTLWLPPEGQGGPAMPSFAVLENEGSGGYRAGPSWSPVSVVWAKMESQS